MSLPPPASHHHTTTGLLTADPFTVTLGYLMSGYQEEITWNTKRKKKTHVEQTDQASEPDMGGILK